MLAARRLILRRMLVATAALLGTVPAPFALGADLADTIERVKPSIVAIGTFERTRNPAFVFRGTGFAVGDGTQVATNAHVLPDALKTERRETLVAITLPGGPDQQPRELAVQNVDRDHDVALLRVSGPALRPLALDDAGASREGQLFAFTGFPIGNVLGLTPVTHRAMISAVTPVVLPGATARQLNEKMIQRIKSGSFSVYQLDATAYPGNSGSPLYDADTARVIGIINMVFVKGTREAALTQPSGITFAVPVRFLRELLQSSK